MDISTIDISGLTVAEKLDLIDRIWESIETEHGLPPELEPLEHDALVAELQSRLEAHERDPSSAIPLEDVLTRLSIRRK